MLTNQDVIQNITDPAHLASLLCGVNKCHRCTNYYREKNEVFCHKDLNRSNCTKGVEEFLKTKITENPQIKYSKKYKSFENAAQAQLFHDMHYPTRRIPITYSERMEYLRLLRTYFVDYQKEKIKCYETLRTWTAKFDDGYEIDVKIYASDLNAPLSCEAVLFDNGFEVACTEVFDKIPYIIEIPYNKKNYCVITY